MSAEERKKQTETKNQKTKVRKITSVLEFVCSFDERSLKKKKKSSWAFCEGLMGSRTAKFSFNCFTYYLGVVYFTMKPVIGVILDSRQQRSGVITENDFQLTAIWCR